MPHILPSSTLPLRSLRFVTLSCILAATLLLSFVVPASAQHGVSISFLPDPAASLDIREAVSPEKSGEYLLYFPSFMAFSRLPGDFNGAVWLRMQFSSTFEKPVGELLVNFGSNLPGKTRLFIPKGDGEFTVLESVPPTAAFTLSGTPAFPETVYARIDGSPGLWFRPVFTEAVEAGQKLPPIHWILMGVFAATMLLLLLQYIRKAEQWRLWAAMTAGLGIIAAFMPANPAAATAYTPLATAAMVIPGLIVVFFAHTARHLFNSPQNLPSSDKFLVFYYLVGAAIALIPLAPGFLRFTRYLPLAFIVFLPLLFPGMAALSRSLKGASAFLIGVVLPVVGTALSAWELTSGGTPVLGESGGLAGLAAGLALLSLVGPLSACKETGAEEDVFDSLDRPGNLHESPALHEQKTLGEITSALPPMETVSQAAPENAFPSLNMFSIEETEPSPTQTTSSDETPSFGDGQTGHIEQTIPTQSFGETANSGEKTIFAEAFPAEPASQHEHQSAFDGSTQCADGNVTVTGEAIPAPSLVDAIEGDGEQTRAHTSAKALGIVDECRATITMLDDTLHEEARGIDPSLPSTENEPPKTLFDLPLLVKEVYDGIALLGEKKNLGMSWFIAPQTGRLFEGDTFLLRSALSKLLRDMVEAVDRGNVRLNIRRLPDSKDPGHIVFSITEWDAKASSPTRNMDGLAEAWALAEKTGGIFSVEHSPATGTTVIFSSVFIAKDKSKSSDPEILGVETRAGSKNGFPKNAEQIATQTESLEAQVSVSTDGVQKFVDHPDIALPEQSDTAGAYQGLHGVDGGELIEETNSERVPSRIIVADITASGRARTAAAFVESPYAVLESTSPQTAQALYARHPSALIIMSGDMPEVDIAAAIRDMHAEDEYQGRSAVPVLALVAHDAQIGRMMQMGCTQVLMKPVDHETLLRAAAELAPLGSASLLDTPPPMYTVISGIKVAPIPPETVDNVAAPELSIAQADSISIDISGISAPSNKGITQDAAAVETHPFKATVSTGDEKPLAVANSTAPKENTGATPEAVLDQALDSIPIEKPATKTVPAEVAQSAIFSAALPDDQPEPGSGKEQQNIKNIAQEHEPRTSKSLIDMIVADPDDEPDGVEQHPNAAANPTTTAPHDASSTGDLGPKPTLSVKASGASTERASEEQKAKSAEVKAMQFTRAEAAAMDKPALTVNAVKPVIDDTSGRSGVETSIPEKPSVTRPAVATSIAIKKPRKAANRSQAPSLANPEPMAVDDADTAALVTDDGKPLQGGPMPSSGISIQLPGEDDSIFKDMIPLVPGLIHDLADAMADAARGRNDKSPMLVQEAAERVAGKAEAFGLTKLERMARCVERAAAADDIEPMECVLEDLVGWVERYKEALTTLHREHTW